MTNTKPARGMRDFLPADVRKREYVIGIVKEVYESYGFEPLETPAIENIETLTGKYGEEGNQLIFKILKRGEKLDANASEKDLTDLALRYDLTVPLARVVANNRNELPKFFKRYQIQPVWRADRPARGRFREFYQCDVDAIGSGSMMVEAELCAAVSEILTRLGFEDFVIGVNHRDVLRGILDIAGVPENQHSEFLIILDKYDKIGYHQFLYEITSSNLPENSKPILVKYINDCRVALNTTSPFVTNSVNPDFNTKGLESFKKFFGDNKSGKKGIEAINTVFEYAKTTFANGKLLIKPILARGLSYYTGAIFEIVLTNGDFAGSIGGGGRYDGLIGMFGKEQIPACGFSLGLERILVVMEERGMFPKELSDAPADVLVTIWNEESIGESIKLAAELRKNNLRVLVYPEADKLGKQFKYADSIKIPFVCVLGESELAENRVTLKNLRTGAQETVERSEILKRIKQ